MRSSPGTVCSTVLQVRVGPSEIFSETRADPMRNDAPDYGNELEAGQGVARAIQEGIVKREELFIASKLWNSFHEADKVEPIARRQLADWGVEYFDLYLMHFPIALKYVDPAELYPPGWLGLKDHLEFSNATIQETWQAMEALVDKKLTRSLGLSNFNAALLMDLLRYARIRPATLQIEHHPYLVQKNLITYAQEQGLVVTAYSSFGPMSFLELHLPDAEHTPLLFNQEVVKSIAEKHGKTTGQVLLRWSTQRNIAVIPKSDAPEFLVQNKDVTGWNLTPRELEALDALDKNLHFNDPLAVRLSAPCGME
jgi:D-xylose reductase